MEPFIPINSFTVELHHKVEVLTKYLKYADYMEIDLYQWSFLNAIRPKTPCFIDNSDLDKTMLLQVMKHNPLALLKELSEVKFDVEYIDPIKRSASLIRRLVPNFSPDNSDIWRLRDFVDYLRTIEIYFSKYNEPLKKSLVLTTNPRFFDYLNTTKFFLVLLNHEDMEVPSNSLNMDVVPNTPFQLYYNF